MGPRDATREKIVRAAAHLLSTQGRDAVTTRSVSAAAGVQAPTIYRLFGDMQGLLDAATAAGFTDYLARKVAQKPSGDPVEDLRAGWDLHVAFGLENPAFYVLMYGRPDPASRPHAAAEAHEILLGLVRRVAAAGRLTVSVDRAAEMVHAAGMGVVMALLAVEPEDRDPTLSSQMREAVLSAITAPADSVAAPPAAPELTRRALALQMALDDADTGMTAGERALFDELLERLASVGTGTAK
jgi:AcrR family transcriptional regulator